MATAETEKSPSGTPSKSGLAVHAFVLGPFETNCYVIVNAGVMNSGRSEEAPCWIADAGFDPAEMVEFLQSQRLRPEAVVLTHAHADHIAGLFEIRRAFPKVPIWIHEAEREWLTDPIKNLSGLVGMPVEGPTPDRLLQDGEELTLCGERWRVLHTPGHSPGGISLVHSASGQALVGDTLFAGSVGRSDFPGSDPEVLTASIRGRLYQLPDETKVYPGHGPPTTIGREKRTNPYVRA